MKKKHPKYILEFIVGEPIVKPNTLEAVQWLGRSTGAWPVCYEKINTQYVIGFPIRKKREKYRSFIFREMFEIFGTFKDNARVITLDENGNLVEKK